jgi:predicted phage baseplate assembly protein
VALTGQRPHGRLAPALSDSPRLVSDDGRDGVSLQPGELVEVLAAPEKTQAGPVVWRLRHHTGLVGSVSLQPDGLEWLAADADSEEVSEILWIAACSADNGTGHAQITFTRAPRNVYDGATVHLNANLALATHGESVQEVLGSGDPTESHQRFTLKKQPLTRYVLPGHVDPTSTLQVFVNRLAWTPTDTLVQLDAHSRAYSVQTDQDGTVEILFGDGTRGARLPPGTENVVATYRTGAGLAGEVRAGSLAQLMTRPLGVRSVTNPVAASGAAPAEAADLVRQRAPESLLHRNRIVSLPDYATFAAARADVAATDVRWLQVGHQRVLHVTVVPVPGSGLLVDDIAAAMRAAQATPVDVQVDLAVTVLFAATVKIMPNAARLVGDLVADVRAALLDVFSLSNRHLAQPVTASDIVRVVQAVAAVQMVDLVAFDYASAAPASPRPQLSAQSARVDRATGRIQPAQVLALDSDHLTVELA